MTTKKKTVVKKAPKQETPKVEGCGDRNCPTHGTISTHGRVFEGTVVSDKMQKTVTVEWFRQVKVQKYERFLVKRSKISAHNSPCIGAKKGDKVRIEECRPISKTVNFVITEVLAQ